MNTVGWHSLGQGLIVLGASALLLASACRKSPSPAGATAGSGGQCVIQPAGDPAASVGGTSQDGVGEGKSVGTSVTSCGGGGHEGWATSCEQGQWRCQGVCVPVGSCQAREVRFGQAVQQISVSPDEGPKVVTISKNHFVYDWTGDGRPDVIYGTHDPYFQVGKARFGVVVIPGLGDCKFDVEHPIYLVDDPLGKSDGFPYLWLGDLNGDGVKDLLAVRTWNKPEGNTGEFVLLYHQPNGAWTEEILTPSALGLERLISEAQVGDIDGDGGMDLLVYQMKELNTAFSLSVVRRSKEGKVLEITPQVSALGWNKVQLRDINGDGRADLFSSYNPVTVKTWEENLWKPFVVSPPDLSQFGDINQDGLDDVVTGEAVWLNEGQGKFKETPWSRPEYFHGLFDLDLDGNLDWHEQSSWRRGDGFGHYEEAFSEVLFETNELPNFDYIRPDVTGDGVYDIVLPGHRAITCIPNIGQPVLKLLPLQSPSLLTRNLTSYVHQATLTGECHTTRKEGEPTDLRSSSAAQKMWLKLM